MGYDLSKLLERLPKDPELEAAQKADANQGNWDRVSDALYSTFTHQPYQALDRGPGKAEQLTSLRDAGMKRLTGAAQLDDIASKLDPESTAAKLYRPIVKSQYGKAGADVPAEVDVASAGDLAGISGALDKYENAAKSKGAVAMDDVMRKALVAKGKKLEESLGVKPEDMEDWEHYPAAKLIDMIRLREGEAARAGTDRRATENHGVQVAKLGQGTERIGIAKEKLGMSQLHAAGEAQKALPVGHALIDPMLPPDPKVSREVEGMTASTDQVDHAMGKLRDILQRNNGRILPTDADAGEYGALFAAALGKVVAAEGMGNLTVAHQNLSHELVSDPTKLYSWLNNDTGRKQLGNLLEDIHHTLSSYRAAHNLRALGAGEKQAPSAYAPAKGLETARGNAASNAPVRVRNKKTGVVKPLPPGDAATVLQNPDYEKAP